VPNRNGLREGVEAIAELILKRRAGSNKRRCRKGIAGEVAEVEIEADTGGTEEQMESGDGSGRGSRQRHTQTQEKLLRGGGPGRLSNGRIARTTVGCQRRGGL
jgi:hypothetical protein